MPQIDIPAEIDTKLGEIAPTFLSSMTARVLWALDELIRMRKAIDQTASLESVEPAQKPPQQPLAHWVDSDTPQPG